MKSSAAGAKRASSIRSPVKQTNSGSSALIVAHHFRDVVGVAFVMQIAELHETAARLRMKIEMRHPQPGRFGKAAIDPGRRRQGAKAEPEKLPAVSERTFVSPGKSGAA